MLEGNNASTAGFTASLSPTLLPHFCLFKQYTLESKDLCQSLILSHLRTLSAISNKIPNWSHGTLLDKTPHIFLLLFFNSNL